MSWAYILVGALIGMAMLSGYLVYTGQQDVDPDVVCENRFGDEWSGEEIERDTMNQSVSLRCTNGEQVENITVGVDVEVDV